MNTRLSITALAIFCCFPCLGQETPLHEIIDQHIDSGHHGPVSPQADDGTFLRRVYLDLTGTIPNVEQAREFLDDPSPTKREDLVRRLSEGPRYARQMASRFDIMLMERRGEHEEWTKFLEAAFADNRPWDQIVRQILAPDAQDESNRGAAFYYTKRLERYGQQPDDMPGLVRDIGRMFMGLDVQCAQCHDHLFVDDYEQSDWQGLFAFVGNTSIHRDKSFPAIVEKPRTSKVGYASVFDGEQMEIGPKIPGGKEVDLPEFKKGEEYAVAPDRKTKEPGVPKFSVLKVLAEQLPSRENPAFSRNAVNRIWWMLLGRGLVEPLDMHHSDNAPSHPELLEHMSVQFADHDFDIRWLTQQIMMSKAYGRSSEFPEGKLPEKESLYTTGHERPLSAEQLLDSTLTALTASPDEEQLATLRTDFLGAFAGPPKEPELQVNSTLKAALFLLNATSIQQWLQPREGSLLHTLSEIQSTPKQIEHLYLATLSRRPVAEECERLAEYLDADGPSDEKLQNLVWAMLASTEFFVNH